MQVVYGEGLLWRVELDAIYPTWCDKSPFDIAPNSEFGVRFPLRLLPVLLIHMRTGKIDGFPMNQSFTKICTSCNYS